MNLDNYLLNKGFFKQDSGSECEKYVFKTKGGDLYLIQISNMILDLSILTRFDSIIKIASRYRVRDIEDVEFLLTNSTRLREFYTI